MSKYNTAELASLVGVSKNTLLRWEQNGLISASDRDGRNWRVWNKAHLHEILAHINTLQKINNKNELNSRVYIIGFGNQAKAWGLNLKDSGFNVKILLNENSKSRSVAINLGFDVLDIRSGLLEGSVFCLLIADDQHEKFFNTYNNYLNKNKLIIFAHGFSVYYLNLTINARKALLAPLAVANLVRATYINKKHVAAAYSFENNKDESILKKLASAIHFKPLYKTSFEEETISDLFTEQVLYCGALPFFILKAFDCLNKTSINKNIISGSLIDELIYILELIKELGINNFYEKISPIAFKGGLEFIEKLEGIKELDTLILNTFSNIKNKKFNHLNFDREKYKNKIKKMSASFDSALKGLTKE